MQFALLDDLFVDFGFGFGAIWILRFCLLLFVESSKVQIFMGFQKLVVFNILVKVHVVELLKVANVLSPVS